MIFSKFLKKKWQHQDSNVRVEAINDSLDVNNVEQKTIIVNLAEQDESENVRRAALIKLADFDLWLKHSTDNTMNKVAKFARAQVESCLLDENKIKLSKQQKLTFISQHNWYGFYETWLKASEESEIIIALFERIANKQALSAESNKVVNPKLLMPLFAQKQNIDVQKYIVEQVNELALLEKLQKKATIADINQKISEKIADLHFAHQQPIKLTKAANLILAKFQALKEQSDYAVYIEKHKQLEQQWQALAKDQQLLADIWPSLVVKYQTITAQLEQLFAAKKEQYQQDKIAIAVLKEQKQLKQQFVEAIASIEHTLTTSIFENEEIDQQQYQRLFEKLIQDIEKSVLSEQDQRDFKQQLAQQQSKLQQLPLIAESVTKATHLISKISQLAMPENIVELNERSNIFQQWLTEWKAIEQQAAGALPESIVSAAQELKHRWYSASKPLKAEQALLFKQCQKKIADLKRLITGGKYNAAFGVHKKLLKQHALLSNEQQHRLSRGFEQVCEQINDLADWEHYIATPRKKELLAEINALVAQPLNDPNAQADKVKQFRKTWNSLGHADDDSEQQLNESFNLLCEQAFKPCRVYFAEQEQLREQHLQSRRELINLVNSASNALQIQLTENKEVNHKSLEAQLNKLQKQWQNAGQVDRSLYKKLQSEFFDSLAPIKAEIKRYHQANKAEKQNLIAQAQALLMLENITEAVEQIKTLQKQWRKVGYAGARLEHQLSQQFRSINHQLFNTREQQSNAEQPLMQAKSDKIAAQLQEIVAGLNANLSLAENQATLSQLQMLAEDAKPLKKSASKISQEISHQITSLQQQIKRLKAEHEKQQWQQVFSIIEQVIINDKPPESIAGFELLTTSWQKKLQDLTQKQNKVSRDVATLELEILAGIASPDALQQQRMAVQVSLMQDQMQSGNQINLNQRFSDWLLAGKMTANDVDMLNRIKPIFIH